MKHLLPILATALLVTSSSAFADDLELPGSTLGNTATTDSQPEANPDNIFGSSISPDCPFIGDSYQQLLRFARVNYPNIYRLALGQRRGGATEAAVRDYLEETICMLEGYGS